MKKQIEHVVILFSVVLAQPLLAVALVFLWNSQHLTYFLDYYHALLLIMIGSGVIILTEFMVMIYQWLYVDEIFDYHRKDKDVSTRNNLP